MIALESKTLPQNVHMHVMPTAKFKTVMVSVFLQQVLERELASRTALLPAVLERGSRRYPSFKDLKRRLEELYGASLGADVVKKGERHIVTFSLEMVNEKYAGFPDLFREGLSVLRSVVAEPLVQEGGFKKDYVEQEKEQLVREIQNLLNDKVNYALERCVQEMCSGERFGVYRYGSIEDLEPLTPGDLYAYYESLVRENPLDVFVIGEVDPDEIFALLEEAFSFPREDTLQRFPPVGVSAFPRETRYREERLPVQQGKLTMGYRTNTSYGDEDYPALLFYNGILGGFPHSKLFRNVREKASLAYYAFSRLEKHKGIQLLSSGIEVEAYGKALEIILEQVEQMRKGEITAEEMENTRRGLVSQHKTVDDSPYSTTSFFLDGLIAENKASAQEMVRKIEAVQKDDVVEAAQKVYLDTIYFLRTAAGAEGAEGGEPV